jgi:long-subunit acyl-CoA synthetase (AMP-forming)
VVCKAGEVSKVAACVKDCPQLKAVVLVGSSSDDTKSTCESAGLQLHTFEEVLSAGEQHPHDAEPIQPDDIATFCYTR